MPIPDMPVAHMPQTNEPIEKTVTAKPSGKPTVDQTPARTSLPEPENKQPSTAAKDVEETSATHVAESDSGSNVDKSHDDNNKSTATQSSPEAIQGNVNEANVTAYAEQGTRQDLLIHQPAVKTIFPSKNNDVPQFPIMTSDERVQNAIAFLNQGNEYQARQELADALVIEPSNRSAKKLIRQLSFSAGNYFPQQEYFEYRLRPHETLISVARKFLDDPLDFYMLAKLNNIKIPATVATGQILKIPGTLKEANDNAEDAVAFESQNNATESKTSAEQIKYERAKVYYSEHRYGEAINLLNQTLRDTGSSEVQPMRELLARNYRDYANLLINKGNLAEAQKLLEDSVSVMPDNNELVTRLLSVKKNREAERLYQLGLDEIKIGKDDLALKTLSKALELNPALTDAKKQISDLKLSVIESYHKKAMVLYRKQELTQAIQIWDEILKLDPSYELAKQYKAKAMELKRRIEQL